MKQWNERSLHIRRQKQKMLNGYEPAEKHERYDKFIESF